MVIRGVIKQYQNYIHNIDINTGTETTMIFFNKVTSKEYKTVGMKPIIQFIFISQRFHLTVFQLYGKFRYIRN